MDITRARCALAFRVILLLSVRLGVPVTAASQQATLNYADLAWGSSKTVVAARLSAMGFTFKEHLNESVADVYSGRAMGEDAQVAVWFDIGGLQKVLVALLTADKDARSRYDDMLDILRSKYGRPSQDFHFFESPYDEGDGYEDTAIRAGKGHFLAAWQANDGSALTVKITDNLTVWVTYEGPGWPTMSDRIRARQAEAF